MSIFRFPTSVLKPVRNFLNEELKRLKKRRSEIRESDPFKDEFRAIDNAAPDLEADEEIGHVKSEALAKQLSKKIIQIKKALARIKVGHYGVCEKCGKFIDTDRLIVYPETTLCVECQRSQKN